MFSLAIEELNEITGQHEHPAYDILKRFSADSDTPNYDVLSNPEFLRWFDMQYDYLKKVDKMPEEIKNLFNDLRDGSISLNSAKKQAAQYYLRRDYVKRLDKISVDDFSAETQKQISKFLKEAAGIPVDAQEETLLER